MCVAAGCATSRNFAGRDAGESAPLVLNDHFQAFNAHNVDAMVDNLCDDFSWYNIQGTRMILQATGKQEFRDGMAAYFTAIKDVSTRISNVSTAGNLTSLLEEVSWSNEQGETSSGSALAVYEVRDGLICRAWYFEEE